MPLERDPASVMWDAAAVHLLARARAARGEWVATRIAQPTPAQRARLARRGIFPDGPDNTSAAGGRARATDARTRWGRAFVRAVYYNRLKGEAVKVEVGVMRPALGRIPRGRAVRVRVLDGDYDARQAAGQLPERKRIFDAEGHPGDRWSDQERRDW
jgi:hypothetical protein